MQKTKVGGPGHREVKPTKRIKPHEINLKQAAPAEDSEPAASSGVPKFGQRLASNDKETRDKAVKTLTRYLKSGPVLEELDLAKIWKALFYCMWHADKPKVQNELAERLGAMVLAVPGNKATLFAKTFFAMMMREWPGIDRLRLNKFYTLLKCVLKNSLRQLHRAGWPAGGAEGLAEVLQLGPLSSRSPPGLRYWLVDNLVPALVGELKAEVRTEVVMALLEPLFIALGDAVDPHSLQRTTDAVDALLEALKPEAEAEAVEDDASGEEEEESAPRLQAKLPLPLLAERLFGLASAKRTRETNRTHLYALQQRVEALAAASGGAPAVGAPAVGAPAAGAPAAGKALAAPRADPVQVDALRRLIGSKAGAKTAARAGAKAGGKAVREAEPGSGAPGAEAAPAAATSPPLSASRPKKKKRPAAAEAEVAEAAEAAEAEAAAPKRPKRLKSAGKAAKASAEAAEAEAPEPPPAAKAARAGARKRKA